MIEKTNEHLTLDTSTLLGGTADIFGSYVQNVNLYPQDSSLLWVTTSTDSSTYYAHGTVVPV